MTASERPRPNASQGAPSGNAGKRTGSRFGPGLIIAASFVGPGTVTTAIVTGDPHDHGDPRGRCHRYWWRFLCWR